MSAPPPLLVGETNPYGADPYYALYPAPHGCAGDRLCRLVMQLDPDDYLARFERVNLCDGKWSMPKARERARKLWWERGAGVIVLLGSKVCAAFGEPFEPFTSPSGMTRLVILPHPSGLCRLWQEPGAYERARAVLRESNVLAAPAGADREG